MSAVGDMESASHVDTGFRKHLDFVDERDGINDDAHTDHRMLFGTEYAARDELENVFFFADNDGVAGVVASGDANDVVERAGQVVYDFAFAFVSPLRAHHDD